MITTPAANAQTITRILLLVVFSSFMLLTACGKSSSDGKVQNTVDLPTDDTRPFNLYCKDVGLYLEDCVLDDPDNPYARSAVTEDTKFDLDADAPSATAKFYLWATALTRGAGNPGENQFYVALNLHRMWASSNSELTRLQALRAYQSYLDNFFDTITLPEEPADSGIFVPRSMNLWTGQMLFDPTALGNYWNSTRLFNPDPDVNRNEAANEVNDWGYFYDQDLEIFSINP